MEQTRDTRRRSQFLSGRGELIVYATFVAISLVLILLPDNPRRQVATHIEDYALLPFRAAVLTVQRMFDLWDTNRRLAEELGEARLEVAMLGELRRENDRLRAILDFSQHSEYRLVGCEILAEGGGRIGDRTLLLDRGFSHGIVPDMPLTSREGLAGKVIEVYPESARAILLTHRGSAVSVRSARSRVQGIVEWLPESRRELKLRGVSYLADVAQGDTLVTSGLGGIFPAGVPVGVVQTVSQDVAGLLLDVTVRAAVDFDRLEEVFALVEEDAEPFDETVDLGARRSVP